MVFILNPLEFDLKGGFLSTVLHPIRNIDGLYGYTYTCNCSLVPAELENSL